MGLDAVIKTKDKDLVYFRNKYYLHRFISNLFPDLESTDLKCELTRSILSKIKKEMKSFIKEYVKHTSSISFTTKLFFSVLENGTDSILIVVCIIL